MPPIRGGSQHKSTGKSRTKYPDELKELCKDGSVERIPPSVHACPTCGAKILAQVLFKRGWAGAWQFVCLAPRARGESAHVYTPRQDGPPDAQLLRIETLRDALEGVGPGALGCCQPRLSALPSSSGLAGPSHRAHNVPHCAARKPPDVVQDNGFEDEGRRTGDKHPDNLFEVDAHGNRVMEVDNDNEGAHTAEDDSVQGDEMSDEDEDDRFARWTYGIKNTDLLEMRHRMDPYRLALDVKDSVEGVIVHEGLSVVIVFLWLKTGVSPTVLRLTTRHDGKLHLADYPGRRAVVMREDSVGACADLGKVLNAVTITTPESEFMRDHAYMAAFSCEKRILARARTSEEVHIAYWSADYQPPIVWTCAVPENRVLPARLLRPEHVPMRNAPVEVWHTTRSRWNEVTSTDSIKVSVRAHTLLVREQDAEHLGTFGVELDGLSLPMDR
ncbi:hypothetical protein OH77DRAFT_1509479 [Trametes cingulata]|nr:hypothetical protein OH77DRAFT_1509479 [Trametes cingulata]